MSTDPAILFVKPGSINPADKTALRDAGDRSLEAIGGRMDYADKSWLKPEWADLSPHVANPQRRKTDREPEYGPHSFTLVERVWWWLGGCVLAGFWACVFWEALS